MHVITLYTFVKKVIIVYTQTVEVCERPEPLCSTVGKNQDVLLT